MESISGFLFYVVAGIMVLGPLVFVHELGHFLAAKACGIRVDRFSLGFPPRMWGKKIGETDYCISWLPLGGYVKMSGMIDESMDQDSIQGEPWEFQSKPIWQRVIAIVAGPLMNILLTLIVATGLNYYGGMPVFDEDMPAVIGEVRPDAPAKTIGLAPGDQIVKINEFTVDTWTQLTEIIHARPEQDLHIEWVRDGERMSANAVSLKDPLNDTGYIGIAARMLRREVGLFEAGKEGCAQVVMWTGLLGKSLKLIFSGRVSVKNSLAGPLKIAEMAGQSARSGAEPFLILLAFLSLNLGYINLLPFPVLDGGHLVFLGIEAVRRKPLSVRVRLVVQQIGMAVLLALMVLVLFNDFRNMF